MVSDHGPSIKKNKKNISMNNYPLCDCVPSLCFRTATRCRIKQKVLTFVKVNKTVNGIAWRRYLGWVGMGSRDLGGPFSELTTLLCNLSPHGGGVGGGCVCKGCLLLRA